jgi:hypothetical protein
LDKPLILLAYLGFPNYNLTRANTLISTEIAAMAKICEDWGFSAAIAKTKPENPRSVFPSTGVKMWDGKTQPEAIWLHQALPNIPGGVRPIHDHTLEILEKLLPRVKKIFRLVVDNNESMNHHSLIRGLKSKGESCYYIAGYKPRGPNSGYKSLYCHILQHIERGTYYEVGYDPARSKSPELNFINAGVFSKQLLLTKKLFGPKEKDIDFCYIGASRSNEAKRKTRLNALGEDLLGHKNSFYGGSLFKKRSSVRFPKAWEMMSRSKAHLITRDAGMTQLPLHRYLQALAHSSIPIVLNEPEPVPFIYSPTLQQRLRVKGYSDALQLVSDYSSLLPDLLDELDYWIQFDSSLNKDV